MRMDECCALSAKLYTEQSMMNNIMITCASRYAKMGWRYSAMGPKRDYWQNSTS